MEQDVHFCVRVLCSSGCHEKEIENSWSHLTFRRGFLGWVMGSVCVEHCAWHLLCVKFSGFAWGWGLLLALLGLRQPI